MARTKSNNFQIAQLSESAMVLAQALDITGSSPSTTTIDDADVFLLHAAGQLPQKVTAANLASYVGGNTTVTSSESQNENFRITFIDPSANTAGLAVDGDTDKLVWNPSSDTLTVGGTVKGTELSGSGDLLIAGSASFGPGATTVIAADGGLTIAHFDANWTNAGITVADLGTVTTVDINGGTIDDATIAGGTVNNTTIGATTQATGHFTYLSASGNLSVNGSASFGIGGSDTVTISAAGVVSGSGTSTLHRLDADRIAVEVLDVNTINSNTITQNTLEIEDFKGL